MAIFNAAAVSVATLAQESKELAVCHGRRSNELFGMTALFLHVIYISVGFILRFRVQHLLDLHLSVKHEIGILLLSCSCVPFIFVMQ
jgi:hypothetical protein